MRTLRAPGIEVHEFDRSNFAENLFDIPATFAMGFANKGTDYDPMYVYSMNDFINTFGIPTNEAERYFYNAAKETFENGGLFIGAKLPYINKAKNTFKYVTYNVTDIKPIESNYSGILSVCNNIRTYKEIELNTIANSSIHKMTIDTYDFYKTKEQLPSTNQILIVDISKKRYMKDSMLVNNFDYLTDPETNNNFDNECIGLVPVIVSPINAIYFQKLIDQNDYNSNYNSLLSSNLNSFIFSGENGKDFNITLSCNPQEDFYIPAASNNPDEQSVSKLAASYFPNILYKNDKELSPEHLKKIGIVVFSMVKEPSNNGKISFIPLESFIGSLDKNDKDDSGVPIFIDNIVNNSSRYINVFSNVDTKSQIFDTYAVVEQPMTSIGFKSSETLPLISYEEMNKDITLVLSKLEDKHQVNIRILLDAGISNIAQYIANISYNESNEYNPEENSTEQKFHGSKLKAWRDVLNKFKYLCENVRKDCLFIADGPRNICLNGDIPVVRRMKPGANVTNSILPNIKYLTGIETSYGTGYLNWFYCYDKMRKEFMWIPPSIKMGGIYTRFIAADEFWRVPAGISNAQLASTYDVAFNPTNKEAGIFYDNNWNYAVSYPVYGVVPEGQKTFQKTKTAFDRVNVRMLFLGLESKVYNLSRTYLYDLLSANLVSRFEEEVTKIMNSYKIKGAMIDFRVVCDNRNNTVETMDNHELRCAIGIKPTKALEWIVLNFICTSQGADIDEVLTQYMQQS